MERKRRIKKHKRKDTKKRYSESAESEDDDSFRKMEPSRSSSGGKRFKDKAQNEEDVERQRHVKKEERKDIKKRYSVDSSESEDEYRSNHSHKHTEKKRHEHKSKSRHRHEEKERFSDKKETEKSKSNQAEGKNSVPDDKRILSKLKNLQNLKAEKRMRAADFM